MQLVYFQGCQFSFCIQGKFSSWKCSFQIMQCVPVMDIGVTFPRFSILLPSAFFLSDLDPLMCLKSKLALSFNIVLRVNALY